MQDLILQMLPVPFPFHAQLNTWAFHSRLLHLSASNAVAPSISRRRAACSPFFFDYPRFQRRSHGQFHVWHQPIKLKAAHGCHAHENHPSFFKSPSTIYLLVEIPSRPRTFAKAAAALVLQWLLHFHQPLTFEGAFERTCKPRMKPHF